MRGRVVMMLVGGRQKAPPLAAGSCRWLLQMAGLVLVVVVLPLLLLFVGV